MGLESLFKRFSPKKEQQFPESLTAEEGRIFGTAANWTNRRLDVIKLSQKPFLLSDVELDVIRTALTEIRTKQLLDRMLISHSAEAVEMYLKFQNYFSDKYQEITQNITEKQILNDESTQITIWNYVQNIREYARTFSNHKAKTEISLACSRIRNRRPVILLLQKNGVSS